MKEFSIKILFDEFPIYEQSGIVSKEGLAFVIIQILKEFNTNNKNFYINDVKCAKQDWYNTIYYFIRNNNDISDYIIRINKLS